MKLFYTGPLVNTEMLVMMLEKHGINAVHESEEGTPEGTPADDTDLL